MNKLTCLVITFAVTVGVYWKALDCGFVFDDHLAIESNPDTYPNKTSWVDIFQHDFWGKEISRIDSNKSYRPITIASFRMNNLFGGEAFHFHLVNIILHGVVASLVGLLSYSISHNMMHVMYSSVLFATHPLHAEAVTGIVGRAEILCAIFVISAYLIIDTRRVTLLKGLSFLVLITLAVLSKEIGITVVVLVLISDLSANNFRSILPGCKKIILCVGAVGSYIAFRRLFLGQVDLSGSQLLRKAENPILFASDTWVRGASLLHVQYLYLKLMFWPTDMCCEYPFDCIPLIENTSDIRLYYTLSLIIVLVITALYGVVMKNRIIITSLAWICVPLIPSSGILVTIGTMYAERLTYIPSVGVCVLVGWFFSPKKTDTGVTLYSGIQMVVFLMLSSHWSLLLGKRNEDWVSDVTLFQSAIKVCPNGAKHHQQYGILLLNKNETEKSLPHFHKAVEIDPDWCEPNLYIGKAIAGMKGPVGYQESQNWWRKCVHCPFLGDECFNLWYEVQKMFLESNDKNASAHHEVGIVMLEVRQQQVAVNSFRQAGLIRHNSEDWEGAALSFELALSSWEAISASERDESNDLIHPCNINYWLATSYANMLRDKSALSTYIKMLDCNTKLRERSFMAAVEGSLQILHRSSESNNVRSRLQLTEQQFWLLHADTLVKIANAKKVFPHISSVAPSYYITAASLYVKLSLVTPSDCHVLSKAIISFSKGKSNLSPDYCSAMLLHARAGCKGSSYDKCSKCSGDVGKKCKTRAKKKASTGKN